MRSPTQRSLFSPRRLSVLSLVATLVSSVLPVHAAPQVSPVTFAHEENLTNLKWDTGWVPKGEKIQVHLVFTGKAGVHATLPADAELDRPGALRYVGQKDQGELKMGLWTNLVARYRIQGLSWQGISLDHEGDLPVPSSFLNKVNNIYEDKGSFTPLILPGASPRPVDVKLEGPKITLLTLNVAGISVSIVKLQIAVPIKVQPILQCKLSGLRVETTPQSAPGQTLVHDATGKAVTWPHDANLHQEGQATYKAKRTLAIILGIYPSIVLKAEAKIGFIKESHKWTIAEFELKQKLTDTTSDWTFAPETVAWDFPAPVLPPDAAVVSPDAAIPPPGVEAGIEPPGPKDGAIADDSGASSKGDSGGVALGDGEAPGPSQISGGCCALAPTRAESWVTPALGLIFVALGLAWRRRRRRRDR
ncbi:MAG: hypothetical protein KAI47_07905 [Deltaproteobacteria bacterium]|nr:hypothetical protein [Deltaproteobacteria bacterium]